MAEEQRDKTKSKRANDHYQGTRQDKIFSQQGRKGHKGKDLLSWIFAAFVAFCKFLLSPLCVVRPLGGLIVKLPVATNGLVLIECRVQLFNGDIAGYSEQKVRAIGDVNIGTVPVDSLPNAGVVQIRVLHASETLGI